MQIDYIASKCMPTFCNFINIYGFLIIFDEGLIRPEKKVTEQFLGLTGKVIYQLLSAIPSMPTCPINAYSWIPY